MQESSLVDSGISGKRYYDRKITYNIWIGGQIPSMIIGADFAKYKEARINLFKYYCVFKNDTSVGKSRSNFEYRKF